jgi:hypothetical protein
VEKVKFAEVSISSRTSDLGEVICMAPVQLERRARQRFDFNLPVSLRLANACTGSGFTQNLSARGVLLCSELALVEGDAVELTLTMPSEVTLAEAMRVHCLGRILRVSSAGAEVKFSAAVQIEKYEYLTEDNNLPAISSIPASPDLAGEDDPAVAAS